MINIQNLIYIFTIAFFIVYLIYKLYFIFQTNLKTNLKLFSPILIIILIYITEIILKINEIEYFYFPIIKDLIILIILIYICKKINFKGIKNE